MFFVFEGIARLCCDIRRQVRMQALTYLQRALLVHDLQTLSAVEWESCFNKVLFPLLAKLLEQINPLDPVGLEETRSRAATLLCKVRPVITVRLKTSLIKYLVFHYQACNSFADLRFYPIHKIEVCRLQKTLHKKNYAA